MTANDEMRRLVRLLETVEDGGPPDRAPSRTDLVIRMFNRYLRKHLKRPVDLGPNVFYIDWDFDHGQGLFSFHVRARGTALGQTKLDSIILGQKQGEDPTWTLDLLALNPKDHTCWSDRANEDTKLAMGVIRHAIGADIGIRDLELLDWRDHYENPWYSFNSVPNSPLGIIGRLLHDPVHNRVLLGIINGQDHD